MYRAGGGLVAVLCVHAINCVTVYRAGACCKLCTGQVRAVNCVTAYRAGGGLVAVVCVRAVNCVTVYLAGGGLVAELCVRAVNCVPGRCVL